MKKCRKPEAIRSLARGLLGPINGLRDDDVNFFWRRSGTGSGKLAREKVLLTSVGKSARNPVAGRSRYLRPRPPARCWRLCAKEPTPRIITDGGEFF